MDNTKFIISKFIETLNNFDYSDSSKENLKNYICYISENISLFKDKYPIEQLLFDASQKLKVFGYTKMNNLDYLYKFSVVENAIKNYHKSVIQDEKEEKLLDGLQKNIINTYQNLANRRIMISAPTSFGKSYLLQEILILNKEEYKNIMIIVPTIALLNENVNKYQTLIKKRILDYTIISNNYEKPIDGERTMFIFTPERALKFLGNSFLKIDFFFFDEVYKIEEKLNISEESDSISNSTDKRAIAFRTCLYLLSKKVKDYYIAGPYLDLTNENSIGLQKYIKENEIQSFHITFDPTLRITYDAWKKSNITENNIIIPEKSISHNSKLLKETQISKLERVKKFIDEHDLGKTIFYVSYPSKISEILKESNIFDVQPIKNNELEEFISHLKNKYNVTLENKSSIDYWTLIKCLEFGIGIHHGKMPKYVQNEILRQFNKPDGLKYLFCTSTIIEGVNTLAKNVVMLSDSIGKGDTKKFSLKNIKGRAGRYYSNFVGRLFYCTIDQKKLDDDNTPMKLEFLNYSNTPLTTIDIDNTSIDDLCILNKKQKEQRESNFNRILLPDETYEQNRLFDRFSQEKILEKILNSDNEFEELYSLTVKVSNTGENFIKLISKILDLEEIILPNYSISAEAQNQSNITNEYKKKILYILKKYENSGFKGLFKYQMQKLDSSQYDNKIDNIYNLTFEQIRTIIEYDIPKYISLYQSLFSRACEIKKREFATEKLDQMIKYYELGTANDFGRLLIERGFPNESIKLIEENLKLTNKIFSNYNEIIDYIDSNPEILSNLDNYEITLYHRIIDLYRKPSI